MKQEHPYFHYRPSLDLFLKSKIEEFHLLGYEAPTEENLWQFLTVKKWRKPQETIHMHQLVNDVLSVKIADYMNFATMEAFKEAEASPKGPSGMNLGQFKDLFS